MSRTDVDPEHIDVLIQDVAARIIQSHWKTYKLRKASPHQTAVIATSPGSDIASDVTADTKQRHGKAHTMSTDNSGSAGHPQAKSNKSKAAVVVGSKAPRVYAGPPSAKALLEGIIEQQSGSRGAHRVYTISPVSAAASSRRPASAMEPPAGNSKSAQGHRADDVTNGKMKKHQQHMRRAIEGDASKAGSVLGSFNTTKSRAKLGQDRRNNNTSINTIDRNQQHHDLRSPEIIRDQSPKPSVRTSSSRSLPGSLRSSLEAGLLDEDSVPLLSHPHGKPLRRSLDGNTFRHLQGPKLGSSQGSLSMGTRSSVDTSLLNSAHVQQQRSSKSTITSSAGAPLEGTVDPQHPVHKDDAAVRSNVVNISQITPPSDQVTQQDAQALLTGSCSPDVISRQQQEEDAGAPSLLRQLASGDIPDTIDQDHLQLLLAAIESARKEATDVASCVTDAAPQLEYDSRNYADSGDLEDAQGNQQLTTTTKTGLDSVHHNEDDIQTDARLRRSSNNGLLSKSVALQPSSRRTSAGSVASRMSASFHHITTHQNGNATLPHGLHNEASDASVSSGASTASRRSYGKALARDKARQSQSHLPHLPGTEGSLTNVPKPSNIDYLRSSALDILPKIRDGLDAVHADRTARSMPVTPAKFGNATATGKVPLQPSQEASPVPGQDQRAAARELTREKLRNLRNSLHSAGRRSSHDTVREVSILSGHAVASVTTTPAATNAGASVSNERLVGFEAAQSAASASPAKSQQTNKDVFDIRLKLSGATAVQPSPPPPPSRGSNKSTTKSNGGVHDDEQHADRVSPGPRGDRLLRNQRTAPDRSASFVGPVNASVVGLDQQHDGHILEETPARSVTPCDDGDASTNTPTKHTQSRAGVSHCSDTAPSPPARANDSIRSASRCDAIRGLDSCKSPMQSSHAQDEVVTASPLGVHQDMAGSKQNTKDDVPGPSHSRVSPHTSMAVSPHVDAGDASPARDARTHRRHPKIDDSSSDDSPDLPSRSKKGSSLRKSLGADNTSPPMQRMTGTSGDSIPLSQQSIRKSVAAVARHDMLTRCDSDVSSPRDQHQDSNGLGSHTQPSPSPLSKQSRIPADTRIHALLYEAQAGTSDQAALLQHSPSSSMTAEKLKNIMDFLDEVEQRSQQEQAQSVQAEQQHTQHGGPHAGRMTESPTTSNQLPRPVTSGSIKYESHGHVDVLHVRPGTGSSVQSGWSPSHATSSRPGSRQGTHQALTTQTFSGVALPPVHKSSAVNAGSRPGTSRAAESLLQRVGLGDAEQEAPLPVKHHGLETYSTHKSTAADASQSAHYHQQQQQQHGARVSYAGSLVSNASGSSHGYNNSHHAGIGYEASLGSHVGLMPAATAHKPAHLAESVFDGVKTKLRRLQQEAQEKDANIARLKQELEAMQEWSSRVQAEAERRAADTIATARAEHDAALERHLGFMDRLLADKDELNRRVQALEEAAKAQEERHSKTLDKLKEGWAAELRRQKEAWAAGEKQRRDTWQAAKTAEVKELTVKGLEVEVQKLLAKHKSELAGCQHAASEESKRVTDILAAQHELALRQQREKLVKEHEEEVEKERAAAAQRLREVSERYEQQISMTRMRMVADHDLRLEQLESARREDRKRSDEALAKAASEADGRVRAMEEEARKEREALRKAHDKQLESLRAELSADQEGWRTALAERSRRDTEQKEAELVDRLTRERDAQIQVIVQRLEAESQQAREALRAELAAREAAAANKHAAAMKEAKRVEARLQEQLVQAAESHQALDSSLAAAESRLEALQKELDTRGATIRWLEAQVSATADQAQATEAARQAASSQALQEILVERDRAEAKVAAAHREFQDLRAQHSAEMEHVEARVRAALARKDEALAAAQHQVDSLTAQLAHTEAVLAAQQAELGHM